MMTTTDKIRNRLIDKILMISNEEYLVELNNLISASGELEKPAQLTREQELMLQMSDADISEGRTISQDEFQKKIEEWLWKKNH